VEEGQKKGGGEVGFSTQATFTFDCQGKLMRLNLNLANMDEGNAKKSRKGENRAETLFESLSRGN